MNKAQVEVESTAAKSKGHSKDSGKRSKSLSAEDSQSETKGKSAESVKNSNGKAGAGHSEKKRKEKDKEKAAKPKIVRDSFTMPEAEYDSIGTLKQSCLALGVAVKKSELLRAGIALLNQLSAEELKRVVMQIENIKTGRPAGKGKKHKGEKKEGED